jgi:hypothetical protein
MPAIARKPKAPTRSELCRELLILRFDNRAAFDRMEAIKSELKLLASTQGKFRENFPGIGYVSVSPAAPEQKLGDAPALVIAAWDALKQPRRDKLIEDGVIRIEPIIKGAYHGRCDVKLFAPPQGASK